MSKNPFEGWDEYWNKYFPPEKTIAMGESLKRSPHTGLPQAGQVVIDAQNPNFFKNVFRNYQAPVPARLTPGLIANENAVAKLHHDAAFTAFKAPVLDRKSGKQYDAIFTRAKNIHGRVELDADIIHGSIAARQLMIAKEYSHFLYIKQHMTSLFQRVSSAYELPQIEDMDEILYLTALTPGNGIFKFDSTFFNTSMELDAAGFYHITPAYGEMKRSGELTLTDTFVLGSNNQMFEDSLKFGYIQDVGNGKFNFQPGFGPFDPRWQEIAYTALH